MGSSKGPSEAEIQAAEREKARLSELRRQAELARLSRGRAQTNLGAESLETKKSLGPGSVLKGDGQNLITKFGSPMGRG